MFVARTDELHLLETRYASDTFELVPIWGRRRVGKTSLLNEFVAGRSRVHFFTAGRTTARENLARLSASVLTWYDPAHVTDPVPYDAPVFPSFEAALAHAFAEASEERTVLVIDEYPYLAESYPGVSSLLQRLIDQSHATCRLMLVLSGSSMSFMEHQVLGEASPLYGRRTAQLRLEPFDYADAALLLGTDDPTRSVELYALVGGIPLYLEQLDGSHTVEWNIAHRMLGQGRFLYGEPSNFLLQEVTSPAPYTAIVDAVAHGRTRPADIASATGIKGPNVNEYLNRLGKLGVVRRETPVGRAHKRQVAYRLADNLLRFWHGFVPRYEQAIELGRAADVARAIVRRDLPAFVGHAFEDVCRQWLARQLSTGTIDLLPSRIGRWWGTDAAAHEQTDVDVVALGAGGELICGECKWTSTPVDASVVETLARRARLVADHPTQTQLLVFSKAGFADSARREAERAGNVRLVELPELFAG